MATRRTARILIAAGAALALVPGLAACSGGQSVADACSVIQNGTVELAEGASDLQTAALSGDEGSLGELVSSYDERISSLAAEITNEDVKADFDRFAGAYSEIASQFEQMADLDLTDMDALEEISANVEKSTTDITESQAALTSTCGW